MNTERDKNIINILRAFGAGDKDIGLLLEYNRNVFDHSLLNNTLSFPLKDEPFVEHWTEYAKSSEQIGVFEALKEVFIQFNFPIERGISKTLEYQSAVKRGTLKADKAYSGLQLNKPEEITLLIHQTPAGKIPIITVPDRNDFIAVIRAVSEKNEPVKMSDSFGASIFSGYNNWNRIHQYKDKFLSKNSSELWGAEFQKLISQKHLYQDKFIILSGSYYSGIKPEIFGLNDNDWRKLSTVIRREHECTHYFTKKVFGSMRNNILDEMLADYAGMVTAVGEFKAEWFLWFMGLENYPDYRKTGRLEIYKGDLTGNAFRVLQKMIVYASKNLEIISKKNTSKNDILNTIIALTEFSIVELAPEKAVHLVEKKLSLE